MGFRTDRLADIGIGLAVVTALVAGASAHAANPDSPSIHVGDGTINGSFLVPYDNAWQFYIRYDDGRREDRGISSDHLRFVEMDGHRYLARVEGTTSVKLEDGAPNAKMSMTFNVFDPSSMATVKSEDISNSGERTESKFDGKSASVTTYGAGDKTGNAITYPLHEPVYDFNGGIAGLLLATLPLKMSYQVVLPVLGEHGPETTSVRVARLEKMDVGCHGPVDAYVVELGPAPAQTTYWVTRSQPYVLRVEIKGPHATAIWEMFDQECSKQVHGKR